MLDLALILLGALLTLPLGLPREVLFLVPAFCEGLLDLLLLALSALDLQFSLELRLHLGALQFNNLVLALLLLPLVLTLRLLHGLLLLVSSLGALFLVFFFLLAPFSCLLLGLLALDLGLLVAFLV